MMAESGEFSFSAESGYYSRLTLFWLLDSAVCKPATPVRAFFKSRIQNSEHRTQNKKEKDDNRCPP